MNARLVALSIALVLTLSACGESSESPDADASERPEYAQNEGVAGAAQFAGFWVDTLNSATETGETEELRSLAAPGCTACEDFAKRLDTIYGAGGRVVSDDWEIENVVPEGGATDDSVGLLVTFAVPPQKVYASEDAKAQKYKGGDQGLRMQLAREDGDWLVEDLSPR